MFEILPDHLGIPWQCGDKLFLRIKIINNTDTKKPALAALKISSAFHGIERVGSVFFYERSKPLWLISRLSDALVLASHLPVPGKRYRYSITKIHKIW